MGVVAKFTKQIVILTTPERGQWIKDQAQHYGVSEAQIARDCIELGHEALAGHYERLGIKPMAKSRRTKRVGRAPAATFVAPEQLSAV